MGTKILVTGGNGQLGSELRELAQEFPSFEMVFTDVAELDITNAGAVQKIMQAEKPAYLINCAAYTAVDKAEAEPEMARKLNALAPGILATESFKAGCRMIHISTDYVFDGTNHTPYTEDEPANPASVYGRTKQEGEQFCLGNNPRSIIIRTAWLYSAFGNNFVKTMIRLGQERDQLGVIFDQVGTPTYAQDLARAILQIVAKTASGEKEFVAGIYHFSNEGVCSWYDFARAVLEMYGIDCMVNPIHTIDYPTPAKRPHYSILDKSKIKTTFELQIPYWRNSLTKCIEKLKS